MMVFPPFNRKNYQFKKKTQQHSRLFPLPFLLYLRKASESLIGIQVFAARPPACAMQGTDAGGKPPRLATPPATQKKKKLRLPTRSAQRSEELASCWARRLRNAAEPAS